MYLLKHKGKGLGINLPKHIVEALPSKDDSQGDSPHLENLVLLALVCKGEDVYHQICEDIILLYLRLAISIAGQYANYCPSMAEDLVAEGFVGCTEGVYNFLEKEDADLNIGGYIVQQIHNRCSICFDKIMSSVRIPRGSYHYLKERENIPHIEIIPDDIIQERKTVDFRVNEFMQDIFSVCDTKEEKQIILLRLEGKTDSAIAKTLGTYQRRISRLRGELWKQWQEKTA